MAAAAVLGTGSLAFGPAELAVDPVLITPSSWQADTGTRAGAARAAATDECRGGPGAGGRHPLGGHVADRARRPARAGAPQRRGAGRGRRPLGVRLAARQRLRRGRARRDRSPRGGHPGPRLPRPAAARPREGLGGRYHLDGSGPPDDRERQLDGCGWVLWALERVHRVEASRSPSRGCRTAAPTTCSRSPTAATGCRPPRPTTGRWASGAPPSARRRRVAGLTHSAELYAVRGLPGRADRVRAAAVPASWAGRCTGTSGRNTSGTAAAAGSTRPWRCSCRRSRRSVTASSRRGTATRWTPCATPVGSPPARRGSRTASPGRPETALVAYTAAASGRRPGTRRHTGSTGWTSTARPGGACRRR